MTATFTYDLGSPVVTGTTVNFAAGIKASAATTVKNLIITVRGPSNENLDLPAADGGASVTIPVDPWEMSVDQTGTFTTPGKYTWGIAFQIGSTWYGKSDATFTIASAPVTPPVVTPPVVVTPVVTAPVVVTPPVVVVDPNIAAPTGNVTDTAGNVWKLLQVEDFTRPATPMQFVSTYTNLGHGITGKYRNDQTCTVSTDSILRVNCFHSGSYDLGSWLAVLPAGQSGSWGMTGSARFASRIRSTGSSSYGTAAMLTVQDNANWGRDGEMDVWEGNCGTSANVNHHTPNSGPVHQTTIAATTDWHTIVAEWIAGVSVKYYRDGTLIASYTGTDVATTAASFMAVIQTASSDNTDNGAPDTATAEVDIDWVAVWQKA
jgi:hypothetical protein